MRIAISGHRGLPAPVQALVDQAIRAALAGQHNVTGLSCLADGPDQIFARAVLDYGGQIEAIIPAALYRDGLPASVHAEYDRLLARAITVHRLPFTRSTSKAHMAASELMIKHAGQLWAVWDGQPARGYGGTADVVAAARANGLPVKVIWPRARTATDPPHKASLMPGMFLDSLATAAGCLLRTSLPRLPPGSHPGRSGHRAHGPLVWGRSGRDRPNVPTLGLARPRKPGQDPWA